MKSKRPEHYCNQPWYVRTYRWLRYKPYYTARAYWTAFVWMCRGGRIPEGERDIFETRAEYIQHILIRHKSVAAYDMGDYLTLDEVLDDIERCVREERERLSQ